MEITIIELIKLILNCFLISVLVYLVFAVCILSSGCIIALCTSVFEYVKNYFKKYLNRNKNESKNKKNKR